MEGVKCRLFHPEVATRPCDECKKYLWDEETGRQIKRHGLPVLRPIGSLVPCEAHPDLCPKGHHSNPIDLSEKNKRAYQHYRECRAVGLFPEDAVVRRNASIIRMVEQMYEEHVRIQEMRLGLYGRHHH